jgi:hypothetical protein
MRTDDPNENEPLAGDPSGSKAGALMFLLGIVKAGGRSRCKAKLNTATGHGSTYGWPVRFLTGQPSALRRRSACTSSYRRPVGGI